MGRMSAVFEVVRNAFKEFCGKNRNHATCKSDSAQEEAINKLVQTSPQLLAFINTGSIPDLCKKGHKEFCGESNGKPQTQRVVETASPSDAASAAEARMDKACTYGLSMTARDITNTMADCAKATNDWEAALKAEAALKNRSKAEAMNQPAPSGAVVVRLTGTTGLPFSGDCVLSNRGGTTSKSFDDILPFQMTFENVDTVNCSFISKSDFRHDMELEILKNGNVVGESNTDAPYGLVSVARDLN
jgi:hypothetical protein